LINFNSLQKGSESSLPHPQTAVTYQNIRRPGFDSRKKEKVPGHGFSAFSVY